MWRRTSDGQETGAGAAKTTGGDQTASSKENQTQSHPQPKVLSVTMQCFKGEKTVYQMVKYPKNPSSAGEFVLTFHYGSRHNQMIEWEGREGYYSPHKDQAHHQKLLACSQIRGWVCDDCFEKFSRLLEGWAVTTKREETRVV